MSKYTGRLGVPIVIGSALLLAACGGDKNKADTALAADTTLNRDLSLAGRDTAAQPQLSDVPATPSGGGATSAKTGGGATKSPTNRSTGTKTTTTTTKTASGNTKTAGTGRASSTGMIASGSTLNLRANSEVCTNTSKVGDKLAATLNESVVGSNGAMIPAGATVNLTVTN